MTATNPTYVQAAIDGAVADFDRDAGPSHINDPLFRLACRLLELSRAAPDVLSEADAEAMADARAAQLGHDAASIRDTWRSALRHTAGHAAHIPQPTATNGAHGGYADLAAFEAARGLPAGALAAMGWSDSELYEHEYTDQRTGRREIALTDQEPLVILRRRRAVRFETLAGPRWRLIDSDRPKPKYWHSPRTHLDSNKAWYRLPDALAKAQAHNLPLVLANGEIAVCVAQHYGIPATCETGGGEKLTPPQLLQAMRLVWTGPILIPADSDAKGHSSSAKKAEQYRQAGYGDVRALDLQLGPSEDLADFCRLHGSQSMSELLKRPDLIGAAQPGQAPPPGQVTQSQAAIAQLAALGYHFQLNLCGNWIEVNGRPLTDFTTAEIRTRLRDAGVKRFAHYEDAWITHAVANAVHPVRDYLDSLTWDGGEHIAQLAACFIGDNPVVTYQDGATCPLASVYLHRWLIGAVARTFVGGQNAMLVFTGAQGLGKSHFARWLCPDPLADRYYLEHSISTKDKDSEIRLMQMFLWEVGELDATTRKQDVAELKDFISKGKVTVRKAYGRYDTCGPALANLIGTVNSSDFLADDTGNRRFYVIDLQRLDWAYQQLDKNQIWAEAVARYRRGEPGCLTAEESQTQTEHNRTFLADSLVGDNIRRYFFVTGDPTHTMSAAEIVDHLIARSCRIPPNDRSLHMDIGRAMAALGVPKRRTSAGRFYEGIMPK